MTGDIRVLGNLSSILIGSSQAEQMNTSQKIRPYARKPDTNAMKPIQEWSILPVVKGDREQVSPCTHNHSVPAVLFSFGGYAGNNFHAIADVIVPLFLTSRRFNQQVQFLVTNMVPWSIHRYQAIFNHLSRYEIIDIDKDRNVHCFSKAIIGLKFHEELILYPQRPPHYSMKDFREFLRTSYSLGRMTAVNLSSSPGQRPRLLIISRSKTRMFTNVLEIVALAESLGYEVTVSELTHNTTRTVQAVNSCDVMMGVHGAGLTNFLFLPDNAVLIQVVPIGGLDWHARRYFGDPARAMKVSYVEYQIKEEESSLINEYPRDHLVFRDPDELKKDRPAFTSICLEKQNVKIDVNRFRGTLARALDLLR
ncbi:hypothetical protein MLD38_024018 [Melastoma candidum]|nr:hypothetical protein MLD38_024018 [Melastoma candidum]